MRRQRLASQEQREPKKIKIADAVKGLELFEQAESKNAETLANLD